MDNRPNNEQELAKQVEMALNSFSFSPNCLQQLSRQCTARYSSRFGGS